MKKSEHSTMKLVKRFSHYYKPYVGIMVMDLFCAALTTVCELILPLIMRKITNAGVDPAIELTLGMIGKLGLVYLALRIVDCLANYYMADMGHVMGAKIETDMRRDAYSHLQKLSNTYYNNTKVGQIMGRITNDLFDVTEFAHHCPEEFFVAFIKTVVGFIILSTVNLYLTVIIFCVVPIMLVVCLTLNRKMKKAFAMQRVQIGELNARIEDCLLGQKVVKAFANEDIEKEKFENDNMEFLRLKERGYRYMATFQSSTRFFDGIMYLAVVMFGGVFVVKGYINPGDLVAYMLYVSTLIATIRKIIEFAEQFQRGITGIERFYEIMDSEIEIFDEPGAVELKNPAGEISFENVSFAYSDDQNIVFTGLNLHIKKGEKIAIVGPSGGGKTTLCNLIPRFYDVTEGTIRLDGRDIKDFTLESLRKNIGMVQQDVYLFSGTVFENIAYGKPGAEKSAVIEAAKRAGAHEFIMNLKDGYDTYVGERGVKLSGGQKQRLSIARVFLKNPPIIILDEATSALDNESEFEVAKSLEELSQGRTSLTIAHRLSSIRKADRIMVLTEDGIVEEGDHDSLLNKKGIYYQYYTTANELR